jgi:hypothetical protein
MGFEGVGLGFLFHHLYVKLDYHSKALSVEQIKIRDYAPATNSAPRSIL